jgi:WD40 repeat protein
VGPHFDVHSIALLCLTRRGGLLGGRLVYRHPHAHSGAATCLLFHGGLLWSGGADKLVVAWDSAGLSVVKALRGHYSAVKALHAGATPCSLWSLGEDRSLRLWRISDKTQVAFVTLDFAPSCAVVGSEHCCVAQSTTLVVLNASTCSRVATLEGHAGVVWALLLSECGSVLRCGSDDGSVREWALSVDAQSAPIWRMVHTYRGHKRPVTLLAQAGDTLLAASLDGVRSWRLLESVFIITRSSATDAPRSLAATSDGATFFIGSADGWVKQYATADGRLLRSLGGLDSAAHLVAHSSERGLAFAACYDGPVRGWRVSAPSSWSRDNHFLFQPALQKAVRCFLCCVARRGCTAHALTSLGGPTADGLVDAIFQKLAAEWPSEADDPLVGGLGRLRLCDTG